MLTQIFLSSDSAPKSRTTKYQRLRFQTNVGQASRTSGSFSLFSAALASGIHRPLSMHLCRWWRNTSWSIFSATAWRRPTSLLANASFISCKATCTSASESPEWVVEVLHALSNRATLSSHVLLSTHKSSTFSLTTMHGIRLCPIFSLQNTTPWRRGQGGEAERAAERWKTVHL